MNWREAREILQTNLIILLTAIVILSAASFRYKGIDCALCKDRIYTVSALEWYVGSWQEVPTLHPLCQDHIASYLAPKEGMTMTEWLIDKGFYKNRIVLNKSNVENIESYLKQLDQKEN